jgi:MFS family permease
MASTVLGGAFAQWPLGYISDQLGRRKTLFVAAVAGVVVALLFVALSAQLSIIGISLLGVAWGAIAFPMYSISVAHANDYTEPSDYVMVSSGLLLTYGVGAILGPFAASAAMSFGGPTGLYAMTGMGHLLLAVYVLQRIFRRESAPEEQHIAFGDALATAYSASQVYEEEILQQAEEED